MTISWRIEEEIASKNIHLFCKFCAVVCRRLLTSSHSCCSCCSSVAAVVVVMLVRCIVPIKSNQYFGYWQCNKSNNTRGKGKNWWCKQKTTTRSTKRCINLSAAGQRGREE